MSQLLTVALTIFYVAWLIAVLLFLWIIWRNGVKQMQKLETTLTEATLLTAHAARQSSEAALTLAQSYTAHLEALPVIAAQEEREGEEES